MGIAIGAVVGFIVGSPVGFTDGEAVGNSLGDGVGERLGNGVGAKVGGGRTTTSAGFEVEDPTKFDATQVYSPLSAASIFSSTSVLFVPRTFCWIR